MTHPPGYEPRGKKVAPAPDPAETSVAIKAQPLIKPLPETKTAEMVDQGVDESLGRDMEERRQVAEAQKPKDPAQYRADALAEKRGQGPVQYATDGRPIQVVKGQEAVRKEEGTTEEIKSLPVALQNENWRRTKGGRLEVRDLSKDGRAWWKNASPEDKAPFFSRKSGKKLALYTMEPVKTKPAATKDAVKKDEDTKFSTALPAIERRNIPLDPGGGTPIPQPPLIATETGYIKGKERRRFKPITQAEVQEVFGGLPVKAKKDGSFEVGRRLTVQHVPEIKGNDYAFRASYKRSRRPGEKIAGSYKDGKIKISRYGDKFTLHHESWHHLENSGMVNGHDKRVLNRQLRKEGKDGTEENRARFVENALRKRNARRSKPLQKVLQKIADFIDGLVNLVRRTSRGIVRELESGKPYKQEPTRTQQARIAKEQEHYAVAVKETVDTLKGTFRNMKDKEGAKADISAFDRIFSLMSHFSNKIPAMNKMFNAGLERRDNFYSYFNDITETKGKESLVLKMDNFRKTRKEEHKKWNDYLLDRDRRQIGYRIKFDGGTWNVLGLKNKDKIASFKKEQDAVNHSMKLEAEDFKKNGFSDQAVDALLAFRTITNNAFDIYTQSMRDLIKRSERIPRIKLPNGDKISLEEALAEIGDMRSFYFPRIRKPGAYMIKATKKGKPPILEFRGNKMTAGYRQAQLEEQGYKVTRSNAPAMPEEIFDLAGKVVAQQSLIHEALKKVDAQTAGANEELKELLENTQSMFAKQLVEGVSDIYKARGHRAHMIRRSPTVWLGYEEDALTAVTKYARGIAAGEAKKTMASKLVRAFTGTDESWSEYKDRIKKEGGGKPSYDDYVAMVKKKRVDPVSQRNAYKEGISYMKEMLRNQEAADRVIGTIRGLAVLKYLAGRVSAPLINLTALITSVPAGMSAYAGIRKADAPKYLKNGAMAYRKWRWGEGVDKWTTQAIEHIKQEGWDNAQHNSESLSVLLSQTSKGYSTLINYLMAGFGASERVNRISTILGTYLGVKANHKGKWTLDDHNKALVVAKEVSDKSHGIYDKSNYPSWARGGNPAAQIARMFYVFRTFSHNYLLTMKDIGFKIGPYKMGKGKNTDFLFMAFAPAFIGGAGASVFTPLFSKVLGRLIGSDDAEEDFYRWAEKNFGDTTSQWLRYGAAGLGGHGVSLKGSLAIGIGDIPTTLPELAGAPGSVLSDVWRGGENILRGDVAKGIEKMLPLFASNAMKAIRESREGVTTRSNRPVFYGREPLKADLSDAFMRALSFNPARLAGIREKQWKEKVRERRLREKNKEIYDRIARFYLWPPEKRTKKRWAKIILMINEYNDSARQAGAAVITRKTIKRSLKRSFRPSKKERTRQL
jgi:hypothetical protein